MEKLELGTRNPSPDFSLNSNGICRPYFCKYIRFSSGPVISRKRPLKLFRSYLSHSIFSSSWKVLRPSISSSPKVQSSVYNFLVLSLCKRDHVRYTKRSCMMRNQSYRSRIAVDVMRGCEADIVDARFARALCLPIGASSAAERTHRPLRTCCQKRITGISSNTQ